MKKNQKIFEERTGIIGDDKQILFGTERGTTRRFEWEYGGRKWALNFDLSSELYGYYKNRDRSRDYDLFASDSYDDTLVKLIADRLKELGTKNGLSWEEIPSLAVSFVQSLPYTSDDVTAGFDEYPRFPYETLYDRGGDCEDTAILALAILREMGYGTVLIKLPGHMAVGVRCDSSIEGSAYEFQGERYCYLETTGENWPIGKIPEEYKDEKAQIIPVYERPDLDVSFSSNYEYNSFDNYVDVDVKITNLGSEWAENVQIYVALQTRDKDKVWDQITSEEIDIKPEETFTHSVKNLHTPTGKDYRIYVIAYGKDASGKNVVSDEASSDWIIWK